MWHRRVALYHCAVSRRAAIQEIPAVTINRYLRQKVHELVKINRFTHEIISAGPQGSFVNRSSAIGGENNYRSVLKAVNLADAANGFKSIESREGQVHQNDVRAPVLYGSYS